MIEFLHHTETIDVLGAAVDSRFLLDSSRGVNNLQAKIDYARSLGATRSPDHHSQFYKIHFYPTKSAITRLG
jgi:hypothetical protein